MFKFSTYKQIKETERDTVSSITKIFLFQELYDHAIRSLAHPAHIHEMGNQFDAAIQEAMNNISFHNAEAMHYFDRRDFVFCVVCHKDLTPDHTPHKRMYYVPADERFLD
jgi:hypothetical protein